jgi:hypothetical protein
VRRFVVVIVLLASCASREGSAEFTLRIAAPGPIAPLNPRLDSSYSMVVKELVFDLLLQPSSTGSWRPGVVKEWTRLGPSWYRLKVDPTVHFSDGSPIRNEDLIASLAAFGLSGTQLDEWVEVKPLDANMPLDPLLLHAVLFKESPKGSLGTGLFKLEKQSAEHILLSRLKPIPGQINRVELLAFANSRDAFAGALRGQVDVLLMPDPGQLELLQGVTRFQLVRAPGIHAVAAVFNPRRLTRADRKGLLESLPIREISRAHGGNCEVYDRARSLDSIPAGRPLELLAIETDPPIGRVALAMRRALGERGGGLQIVHVNLPASEADEKFDIVVRPLQVWPANQATMRWRTGVPVNLAGYSNSAVDEAINAGDYTQADREFTKDPPALFICLRERSAAIDRRIKNPKLGPYGLLESLPQWEVAP